MYMPDCPCNARVYAYPYIHSMYVPMPTCLPVMYIYIRLLICPSVRITPSAYMSSVRMPTANGDGGGYMSMLETGLRRGYSAALVTPFMNTTHKCLRLFYRFVGTANSAIYIFATDVNSKGYVVKVIHGTQMTFWAGIHVELPAGLHWLGVFGIRGEDTGTTGLQIDDLEITQCVQHQGTLCSWIL